MKVVGRSKFQISPPRPDSILWGRGLFNQIIVRNNIKLEKFDYEVINCVATILKHLRIGGSYEDKEIKDYQEKE